MKKLLFGFVAAGLLSACSTFGVPAPQSPAQTVYEAKATFLAAITIADQYKALPACPASVICSDKSVIAKLRMGANAASATLDAAEATVRDPNFKGGATDAAIVAAENAVTAFATVANQLKVK